MEESKKARVVGVVGAGVMGVDLALDLAIHGHEVVLVDNVDAQLESVPARIRSNLRFMKLQGGVKVAAPTDQLLARIQRLRGLDALADAEFVVENVVEDEAVKKEVYGELGTHVRPDAILCANTSCVPITKIGSWVPFPERVVGTHFMNPVPLKSMVEVIRGDRTSEQALGSVVAFLEELGKAPIVANDAPGFVTNRVLMLTINEAIWVLHDGTADARSIDQIFQQGFGHPLGPLATADLIGLDTILASLLVLYDNYCDPKYRPCPLLRKLVDAGRLGRKSGEGFFRHA